jgi:hypothetical protein
MNREPAPSNSNSDKSSIEQIAATLYPYMKIAQGDYGDEQKYIKNRGKIDRYRAAFVRGANYILNSSNAARNKKI